MGLLGSLKLLLNGDTEDRKTMERMIDTFVKAVYVYDTPNGPRGKIVCNYTGKNSELELSFCTTKFVG